MAGSVGIVVCLKLVPLDPAAEPGDPRFSGSSPADQTALEHGLRLAAELDLTLAATTVGPPAADALLSDAMAVGADIGVRIPAESGASSADVGRAIAEAFPSAMLFICGDYSLDRGTGSVPAFIAHHRGAAQALGLARLTAEADDTLLVVRRLDQGRREELEVPLPAVVSVDGSLRLRRASLPAMLAARSAEVEKTKPLVAAAPAPEGTVSRLRPRTRVVAAPTGDTIDRVRALTGADVERTPPQLLELSPDEAADVALERLIEWGYLSDE